MECSTWTRVEDRVERAGVDGSGSGDGRLGPGAGLDADGSGDSHHGDEGEGGSQEKGDEADRAVHCGRSAVRAS